MHGRIVAAQILGEATVSIPESRSLDPVRLLARLRVTCCESVSEISPTLLSENFDTLARGCVGRCSSTPLACVGLEAEFIPRSRSTRVSLPHQLDKIELCPLLSEIPGLSQSSADLGGKCQRSKCE